MSRIGVPASGAAKVPAKRGPGQPRKHDKVATGNTGEAQKARREREAEFSLGDNERLMRRAPKVAFADIEDRLVHVTDVVAKVGSGVVTATGGMTCSLYTGQQYAHDVLDAVVTSQRQFVMVRVYTVPRSVLAELVGEDEDDAG